MKNNDHENKQKVTFTQKEMEYLRKMTKKERKAFYKKSRNQSEPSKSNGVYGKKYF